MARATGQPACDRTSRHTRVTTLGCEDAYPTVLGVKRVTVRADDVEFRARVRLDTPREREYFRHGGILQYVLRRLLSAS